MQPYQAASEELIGRGERPRKALKQLGQLGISVAAGSSVINRVLPLLSKYIPPEIAEKGLNKINPNFGKFIKRSLMNGNNFEQVRDFIKNKVQPKEQLPEMATNDEEAGFEQPKQQKKSLAQGLQEDLDKQYGKQPNQQNIIQQYSPELFQLLKSQVQAGSSPVKAATEAAQSGKFAQVIKQMQNDHKIGFGQIVQSIFGNEQAQPQQQGQQQPGKGQQALMQSMQQLTQLLGNKK